MKQNGRRKTAPKSRKRVGRRDSEEMLAKLFEESPSMIAIGTLDGKLVDVNRAYASFFGFERDEMVGRTIADLGIITAEEMRRLLALGKGPGEAMREIEVVMRTREGSLRHVLMSANIVVLNGVRHRVATLVDVTDRKRVEEDRRRLQAQLLQSQKMESVGRLAGGIAHDFNNILTAINALTGFALAGLPEDEQRAKDLREVLAAGERAARLTKQLLAFSRRQILAPEIVDLNGTVAGMAKMLERVLGEHIELSVRLDARPCLALVDAGQIEQVLLNLAVNARDAMPEGGNLTFETRVETPGPDLRQRHPELCRGSVVRLLARDTGIGMTEQVKAHVFEPFFTTKERGKGTGLGLSTVYGIIKQSGGEIEIDSRPGRGTSFMIYLPLARAGTRLPGREEARPLERLRGNETVLLVEDDETLRELAERVLAANGYIVLAAANGGDALDLLARHGKPVDVLVTDVVMPGMSGRDLSREIAKKNFAHRTLFISGHTDADIVSHGVLEPGLAFLNKPFTLATFLAKVREVLDGPADRARP